jgi:hypothetical protein
VQDYTLGLQQQLSAGFMLSLSYVHTYGDHLEMVIDSNLPPPQFQRTYQLPNGTTFQLPFSVGPSANVNGSRPNPALGAVNTNVSTGESWYNGLLVDVRRRMARGVEINGALTWSKAENTAGNDNGGGAATETAFNGGTPADQFNLRSGRATSALDQRIRGVASAIWQPLWKPLSGFRFGAVETAESGRPVAAFITVGSIPFLGPDGKNYNGFGGIRGQGTGGDRNLVPTIPRNSIAGPANLKLDLRVARDLPVTENLKAEVLVEAFNVFNRSNYNGFNTTMLTASATTVATPLSQPILLSPAAGYLQPNNDASPPDGTNARRLQLAVRFRF